MIELDDLPELKDAVMIAAFEGWNDAGEAASAVIEHLAEIWDAEVVAALDPEDYYDFQVNRPRVLLEGGKRRISWRTTRVLVATDTPPKVTITEYVDVAKAFYPSGKEAKFVNAVLDHMAREARPDAFA